MKERRCKHCNTLLSMYNPGKFCFCHASVGAQDKLDKKEERIAKSLRKQYAQKKAKRENE